MTVAQEVYDAILEAGAELEGSPYTVVFMEIADDTPWHTELDDAIDPIPVADLGIKLEEVKGSSDQVAMRTLLVPSVEYEPKIDHNVTLDGKTRTIKSVNKIAPFGTVYLYKVHVAS